jgi:hypothetical protein
VNEIDQRPLKSSSIRIDRNVLFRQRKPHMDTPRLDLRSKEANDIMDKLMHGT